MLDERHCGGDWQNPPVRIFKPSHAHLPQKDPRNSRPPNQLMKGANQPVKGAIPTQSGPHPDPISIRFHIGLGELFRISPRRGCIRTAIVLFLVLLACYYSGGHFLSLSLQQR
jgi:hypothetical protein